MSREEEKRCAACKKASFRGIRIWQQREKLAFTENGMVRILIDPGLVVGATYRKLCGQGKGLDTVEGFDKCISPREFERG